MDANFGAHVVDNLIAEPTINGLRDNHYMVAGDFDRNGFADVLYIHKQTGANRLILNRGNGQFDSRDDKIPRGAINGLNDSHFVLAGDFDGNGYSDVLYINKQSGANRLVFNRGNEQFDTRDDTIPISGLNDNYFVIAGDFDGNGYSDILYVNKQTGENRQLLSFASLRFESRNNVIPRGAINGLYDNHLVVGGDFDNNGLADTLYVHKESGANRILFNQGQGQFTVKDDDIFRSKINNLKNDHLLVAGDFDRDGDSDLLYVQKNTGSNRLLGYGNFDIEFSFHGISEADQKVFEQAAAKWESIVVGDLPNAVFRGKIVDDLLIDVTVEFIDGKGNENGNTLAQGWYDRTRSDLNLPYHGGITVDSADLSSMNAEAFFNCIVHEIGHVLGIGTLWDTQGLLVGKGSGNPMFIGKRATEEYKAIFQTRAIGVPVENKGMQGTRDAHWRESVFQSEVMSSGATPGTNQLSRITAASLGDLGYIVNMSAADAFSEPPLLWAPLPPLPPPRSITSSGFSSPYQNEQNRFDVDNDGRVSPLDVLTVVNDINQNGSRRLTAETVSPIYVDVDGDGNLSPLDVLVLVNFVNQAIGEGEMTPQASSPSSQLSYFELDSVWADWRPERKLGGLRRSRELFFSLRFQSAENLHY